MIQKRRLNDYLSIAVDVVEDLFIRDMGKVPPEYDNAVSKFGVAVRQLGMRVALTAYSKDSAGGKTKKTKIIKAINRIIEIHKTGVCSDDNNLLQKDTDNPQDYLLKKKITDAATALKLAMRLFIVKDDNKEKIEE